MRSFPQKKKTETRLTVLKTSVFETVFRLIALNLTHSRMTAAKALPKSQASGFDYGVNL